jgi:hypothetical protein
MEQQRLTPRGVLWAGLALVALIAVGSAARVMS